MNRGEALKKAARDSLVLPFLPEAWRDILTGLRGAAFVLVRLALLVAFPVSVPLVAYWVWSRWWDEEHDRMLAKFLQWDQEDEQP